MSTVPVTELLRAARSENPAAQDTLLRTFEPWLRVLARAQVDSRFGAKFDPADIVQQTLLEAVRGFASFRGTTEAELAAWLRTILGHVLAHEMRRYEGTQKRDLAREVSFDQELSAVSQRLGDLVPAAGTSPASAAIHQERALQLARPLESLPDDYRTVLVLRHLEDLPHEEIARRMNRPPGAVRMLWVRALARLREAAQGAFSRPG